MFDYLIIFDIEATCDRINFSEKVSEIIEIGATKVDKNGVRVDTYQMFVKPIFFPVLSDFCKSLTTITQEDVDDALTLERVWTHFIEWATDNQDSDVFFCSWGAWDNVQIRRELKKKAIPYLGYGVWNTHIDLKTVYSKKNPVKRGKFKRVSMRKALQMEKIPLEGTHHRGIDDALNIEKIVVKNWEFFLKHLL